MWAWLEKLIGKKEQRALGVSDLPHLNHISTLAGVTVSEKQALTVAAVWCAVSVISQGIASLPLIMYRRLADGGKEIATDHPLYSILHDSPNDETTSFVLRETAQAHLLLTGNAFLEIIRDGAGRPIALWQLDPRIVTVVRSVYPPYSVEYRIHGEIIDPANLVHVPGLSYDGIIGYSPISIARQSLGRMIASDEYAAALWGNSAKPGGLLKSPVTLSDNARANLLGSFKSNYGGAKNAGKLMLLEEGIEFQPLSFSPRDTEFLGQQQWSISEVARWFNVAPVMLHELEGVSQYGTLEQLTLLFVNNTLRPWLIKWEQELNRKLLMPGEKKTLFIEHHIDSQMRADSNSRMQYYMRGIQSGILCPNECRVRENLNKVEGGDTFLTKTTFAPNTEKVTNDGTSLPDQPAKQQ